jgi:hypothetical protein
VLEEVFARAKGEKALTTSISPRATLDPPDTMLVPRDAWEKALVQLSNLHQTGRELAEARERAAKAETERDFLRVRLRELQHRLEHLEALVRERESHRISETGEGTGMYRESSPDSSGNDVEIEWRDERSEKPADSGVRWSWRRRT